MRLQCQQKYYNAFGNSPEFQTQILLTEFSFPNYMDRNSGKSQHQSYRIGKLYFQLLKAQMFAI